VRKASTLAHNAISKFRYSNLRLSRPLTFQDGAEELAEPLGQRQSQPPLGPERTNDARFLHPNPGSEALFEGPLARTNGTSARLVD
jgi:hypothetical protein